MLWYHSLWGSGGFGGMSEACPCAGFSETDEGRGGERFWRVRLPWV
jgi:hypothetical protein